MTETPDRGPETELKEPVEKQRTGDEPEDLLRSTEEEQFARERELRRQDQLGEDSSQARIDEEYDE